MSFNASIHKIRAGRQDHDERENEKLEVSAAWIFAQFCFGNIDILDVFWIQI